MPETYKRILAALAVAAAFIGIAIAMMVDLGVTARWTKSLSRRDGPVETDVEPDEETETVTPYPGP